MKLGQGGQFDAEGGADGAFEHAANPNRNAVVTTHIVDLEGTGEAAGASGLDVDVLTGVDFQRLLDGAQLAGGLVEADGRLDLA